MKRNPELYEALGPLFETMPVPRGFDADKLLSGYVRAVGEFPLTAVTTAVEKFLRGEYDDFSKAFCPRPPELAEMVRAEMRQTRPGGGREYIFHKPKSKILKSYITKPAAFEACDRGEYPKGSIWVPGPINDNPKIGSLYAPDEKWKPARPAGEFHG